MSKFCQSKYKPSYPQKYKGDPNNIICRSSWERKFCKWCDLNSNVLSWASEEFSIPYVSPVDRKVHRYFPDYLVKVREQNDKVKTYVVEVKPKKQTLPPKQTTKKRSRTYINEVKTYAVNQAKWKAAEEFCLDNGVKFLLVTEDQLGIK